MKVIVLGSQGMLGNIIKFVLDSEKHIECKGYTHQELDIRNKDQIDELLKTGPDVIINCAAYTNVTGAELNKDLVFDTNVIAPTYISKKCEHTKFIHFSSDYVFDGEKEIYTEEDTPNPLNRYGWSKYLSELGVLTNPDSLVIRVSWLFGPNGRSFVSNLIHMYENGQRDFNIVDDQRGKVTYTADIAINIKDMFDLSGIYHFANKGVLSWYELAQKVFDLKNVEVNINPLKSSDYNTKCNRPKNSVLNTSKIEEKGIYPKSHTEVLYNFLK